ncbi:MAG: hypothetical protein GX095_00660, partial [Clostridiales bacterium]|nr:hypothetical protein [Clostridiales bacterium]
YKAVNEGASVSVTVNVLPKPIQITAAAGYTLDEALTKPYDKTDAVADLNKLDLQGTIAGDDVAIATAAYNGVNANPNIEVSFTLGGIDACNYEIVDSYYGTIQKRQVTYTAGLEQAPKTYDGSAEADVSVNASLVQLDGLFSEDDLSIKIVGIAYFNSKNVLDANTVTVEIALVGDAAGNYRLENGTVYLEGSIVPKGIDVVIGGSLDKTYDGTSSLIVGVTLSGVEAGDNVGVTGAYYNDAGDITANADANIVKFELTGDDKANYSLNNSSFAATIAPKAITITGIAVIKTYDKTTDAMAYVNTANAQINGKIGLDVINFSVISAEFDSVDAIEQDVAIKVTLDNDNYTCEDFVVRGRIVPKTLTASLTLNKTYDGTTDIIGTITLSGIEDGDDVNVTGAYEDKHFGDNKKINLYLGGDHAHNYCIAPVYGKIFKLAITIDPGFENDTATMVYNGEAYVLNIANIEGIANLLAQGDVLAGGTLTSFVDYIGKHGLQFGDRVTIKDAFNSSVTHNYDITLKNSYVEITKRPVAILPAPSVDPTDDAFSKPYDATSNINMDKLVLEAFDYTGGDSGVIAKDIGFVQFRGLYLDDESRPAVNVSDCVTIKFELYGSRAYNYYITNEEEEGAITARVITITQITTNKIWKYFDGNNEYNGSLVLNTHFSMTDAIEGETIEFTISNKRFNSIYAPVANFITVTFSLTSASVNQNYLLTGPGVTEPASVININFEAHIEKRSDPLKIEIIPSAGQSKICEMHPWLNVPMASFANNEIATFTISGNVNASIPSGINLNKTFKVYKLTRLLAGESVPAGSEEISLGGDTRWYYDPTAPLSEGLEGFEGEPNSLYYIVPNAEYQPTNPDDPASQRALESVQVISTPSFIQIGTP